MMHSSVEGEKDSASLFLRSFSSPDQVASPSLDRESSVLDAKFQVRKQSYGALNCFSRRETLYSSMKGERERLRAVPEETIDF